MVLLPLGLLTESEAGFSDQAVNSTNEFSSCGGLTLEAEDAALTGNFVIANDGSASGGSYVHVPNGTGDASAPFSGNAISFCVDVPTTGMYTISGVVASPTSGANTFFVTVNDSPSFGYLWDTPANMSFASDLVQDRGGADPVEVYLEAGFNTLTMHVREDGTRLDQVTLNFLGPYTCGGLLQEAEDGLLSGDFIVGANGAASNGLHAYVPFGSQSSFPPFGSNTSVTFCFEVTTAGTYRVRGVVDATSQSDSFYASIDGLPSTGYVWDLNPNADYATDYLSARGGADPVQVSLSVGQHTVEIFVREDGTILDELELEFVS